MVSNPFVEGAAYVSKQDSQFETGERLRFERQTFSPYDDSYVFVFRSVGSGAEKYWLVHSKSSSDSWREYFEMAD